MQALAGYDLEAFLEVFYTKMGTAYLKPHEAGLRSVFRLFQVEIPACLHKVKEARRLVNEAKLS